MDKEKNVQVTFRTTLAEKEIITRNADKKGLSVNEFIKSKVLSDDTTKISKNDIMSDSTSKKELEQLRKDLLDKYIDKIAFESLQKQLEQKDNQIDHLQRLLVTPETSQKQQNTASSNDTKQHAETSDIQGIQQNETLQETISSVTKQHNDTPPETPNLIGRLRRGFNAFLK